MDDITAVILAAGLGVRMGARGRLCPKGLIEVGGAPMVGQSVDSLWRAGVGRIRIVTGHLADQYRAAFAGAAGVDLVHNPDFDHTGSLLSLEVGLDGVDGPCLLLESDLIFEPRALDAAAGGGNRLLVSGPTGAGDEVWVWDRQGRLAAMSKDRDAIDAPPLGELVGVTHLTAETVPALRRVARAIRQRTPEEHYEPALVALAAEVPVACHLVPDLAWAEIDDEAMLARAERVVVPRIRAARARAA